MMLTTTVQPSPKRSEWFASWFDSVYYHKLYAYRDANEAARFLDELIARLGPRGRARVRPADGRRGLGPSTAFCHAGGGEGN